MKHPVISVIIPVFNRSELVRDTLDSILSQTYQNWECIIVDDGSTDDTWKTLCEYAEKDNRFKIFKRDREPKGAPTCRNKGARQSSNDYIMFLDSDDFLAPYAIESRSEVLKNLKQEDSCYVFDALEFDENNPKHCYSRTIADCFNPLKSFLNFENVWATPCVLWNKREFLKTEGWKEKLISWQDPELHIRALIAGIRFKWIPSWPDVFIRKHNHQIRISSGNNPKILLNYYKVFNSIRILLKESDYKREFNFFPFLTDRLLNSEQEYDLSEFLDYARYNRKKSLRHFFFFIFLYIHVKTSKTVIRFLSYRLRKHLGFPNFKRKYYKNVREYTAVELRLISNKLDSELFYEKVPFLKHYSGN